MTDGHHESATGGPVMVWDHEDCPLDDCDGELQQQDKFNVMCLECETVWTHVKSETSHYLQTEGFETVAEKPVAISDGGDTSGTDLDVYVDGERAEMLHLTPGDTFEMEVWPDVGRDHADVTIGVPEDE